MFNKVIEYLCGNYSSKLSGLELLRVSGAIKNYNKLQGVGFIVPLIIIDREYL